MGDLRDGAIHDSLPPSPPRWKGIQSLDLVHQFNEGCLELLSEMAAADVPPTSLPIVMENRELWARLDPEDRRRAARMPFVIVDARFKDDTWWRRIADSPAPEGAIDEPSNGWPRQASEHLMHEATMFAWQTARWDRTVAQLSLGMSRPVADLIATLTPRQIRAIAAQESRSIRVRWADDPRFWADLLVAAKGGDEGRLAELHLHAKLLLCGELAQLRN